MKKKLFLTLSLIFITVVSLFSFLGNGTQIIGTDFYESGEIRSQRGEFINDFLRYELHPIDFEELKASLQVSEQEITYYREYYGTLRSQVENVRLQYESLFEDEGLSTEDREFYVKERDLKIEEIRKNFENDEAVEQKILAIKERALEKYETEYNKGLKRFENDKKYFGYQLTSDKGTSYESTNSGGVADTKTYTNDNYLLSEAERYLDLSPYLGGEPGIAEMTIVQHGQEQILTGKLLTYKSILKQSGLATEQTAFEVRKILFYTLWGAGIVCLVLLLTIGKPNRETFSWPTAEIAYEKLPLDFQIIMPIFSGIMFFSLLESIPYQIYRVVERLMYDAQSIIFIEALFLAVMCFVCMGISILTTIWFIREMKTGQLQLEKSMFVRVGVAMKESYLNRTIGKQTMTMFIVFFLGGMGFAGSLVAPALLMIYIPLFLFIFLPVTFVYFKRMGYLNKIMQQTEAMAAGELTTAVEVRGQSPIAKHAENLNDVRKGIEVSVKEQAKSERLKTELITNVSHDLRTPLTSIITYTDLLKNPMLTAEEHMKYVGILDKKSARLKTLIEDLFEVSKMASGNIEIIKHQVDLAQMLQQTVAEHEEEFMNAGLDLRIAIHDQPVFAQVDGQKWWRVVDNLFINARKYSLAGTRVYVTLKEEKGVAEFSVKNIAKYELGDNIEELTERFKRADTSRHTEGSGLGLAIAQSIVDLHGGQMTLEVDGDLFKVTVRVNTL